MIMSFTHITSSSLLCMSSIESYPMPRDDDTALLLGRIKSITHVDKLIAQVRLMSCRQLALVIASVLLVICGNAGQLLVLNLWVNHMEKIPPAFTVLTVSATAMAVGFCAALLVRIIWLRVSLRFLLSWRAFALSIVIGLCNASNGVLLVYATRHTPEILQALLLCTQVFWTLVFAKIVFHDNRTLLHGLVAMSFVCVAGGIVLGASPQFSDSSMTRDAKLWTVIFGVSMIPGALYNVFASMYMRRFTHHALAAPSDPTDVACNSDDVTLADNAAATVVTSDDTTVKLTMLATTGLSQVMWMFVLLPLDSAPWFGGSTSVQETTSNLTAGWECVLEGKHGCTTAYIFFLAFNVSYFCNYVGSAYLNHFSATLNSMVSQLSAPMAGIVLILFPVLNVTGQVNSVAASIGAILLLVVGSILYTMWEQGTRHTAGDKEKESTVV